MNRIRWKILRWFYERIMVKEMYLFRMGFISGYDLEGDKSLYVTKMLLVYRELVWLSLSVCVCVWSVLNVRKRTLNVYWKPTTCRIFYFCLNIVKTQHLPRLWFVDPLLAVFFLNVYDYKTLSWVWDINVHRVVY